MKMRTQQQQLQTQTVKLDFQESSSRDDAAQRSDEYEWYSNDCWWVTRKQRRNHGEGKMEEMRLKAAQAEQKK